MFVFIILNKTIPIPVSSKLIVETSVPKFIQGYNGKPALVTKSGTFTRHENYIEFSINVNMWGLIAKKGLFALVPTFPDFIFNVGFTIEARKDEEMPGEFLRSCPINCNSLPNDANPIFNSRQRSSWEDAGS